MSDIHITAEIPEGASPEEKTTIRAGAYRSGLALASASPEFRLRMIMGDAYQRYNDLLRWIADEIAKDEDNAPGLTELAKRWAAFPGNISASFPKGTPAVIGEAQQDLLEAAADLLGGATELPLIEHEPCSE